MEPRYRPKRDYRTRTRFDVAGGRRTPRFSSASRAPLPRIRKAVIVAVLLLALALVAVAWFLGDDFRIKDVKVQNNQGVPVAQIAGASGLIGEHMLFADLDAAAQRVNDLPGVDAVRVTCTWGSDCVILVQASQALATWQGSADSGPKVWVDRQGKVQRALGDVASRLTVRVEDGELPAVGSPLDTGVLRGLNELLALQPQVTRYTYSSQYGLMYTNQRGWYIRLGVAEYDGAMGRKLEIVRQLSDQLVARRVSPKVMDVRFANAPYYVK
jgi:cell division septal protein FtsQ